MPKYFFRTFVIIILVIGVLGLITGEIEWSGFIGGIIAFSILELLRKNGEKKNDEVEYDERVNNIIFQFTTKTLFISISLLLIYLAISQYVLEQPFIRVNYLMLYIIVTFYIALFLGPTIIKKK